MRSAMIAGQDIVVACALLLDSRSSVRVVGTRASLSTNMAHRSIQSLVKAGIWDPAGRRIITSNLLEFLPAVRFLFPVQRTGDVPGVPTAWAAPPLVDDFSRRDEAVPVWPSSRGTVRGIGVEPIHPSVPGAALADRGMYELLALVDGLRWPEARIREHAKHHLSRVVGEVGT